MSVWVVRYVETLKVPSASTELTRALDEVVFSPDVVLGDVLVRLLLQCHGRFSRMPSLPSRLSVDRVQYGYDMHE